MKITDFLTETDWEYELMGDGTIEIFNPVTGVTSHVIPAFLAHTVALNWPVVLF